MKTIWYCLFLIVVIIIFSYLNSQRVLEKFTPALRQMYRPVIRKARVNLISFYDNTSSRMNNFFRKTGIL
jgi:hypothetical protein